MYTVRMATPDTLRDMAADLRGIREAVERGSLPASLRLFTLEDVSRMLGISARSVRKLVRSGAIGTVDVAVCGERAMCRVTQAELERFIAERTRDVPPKAPPEPANARRRIAIDPSCL